MDSKIRNLAENLGDGNVVLQQTIAERAATCRVIVYLKPTAEAEAASGRECFKE